MHWSKECLDRDVNAVSDLRMQPECTLDGAIAKEALWTAQRVAYLRPLISD